MKYRIPLALSFTLLFVACGGRTPLGNGRDGGYRYDRSIYPVKDSYGPKRDADPRVDRYVYPDRWRPDLRPSRDVRPWPVKDYRVPQDILHADHWHWPDTAPFPAADLVMRGLEADIYDRSDGTATVILKASYCNVGGVATPTFSVGIFTSQSYPPKPQQKPAIYNKVTLKAGECGQFKHKFEAGAGKHKAWAYADVFEHVLEANESNNLISASYLVKEPHPLEVDLTIRSFRDSISQTSSGTNVRYSAQICNEGTATSSSNLEAHVYYNRTSAPIVGSLGDQYLTLPQLGPGACSNRSFIRYGVPNGSYLSWVLVDPRNQQIERNEANNVAGPLKVIVGNQGDSDLVVESFSGQSVSTSIRYQVKVCNRGKGPASNVPIHLYYDRVDAPRPAESGDQLSTIRDLKVGSCHTSYITRSGAPPAPAGAYISWVQLDPFNVIDELNENNNLGGPFKIAH